MKYMRQLMTAGLFALLSFLSLSVFALAIDDGIKATDNLNIRSTADSTSNANVITTMPAGGIGKIIAGPTSGTGYTWWRIQWDGGYVGWSVQDFIALNTPYPKPFSSGTNIQTVGTERRAGPSHASTIYSTMPANSTGVVNYGPSSGNGYLWWYITWSTGVEGWSKQDFLVAYTPPASSITSVSVSCSPTSIQVNNTSQCSASVSGTGSYSSAVNWSVPSSVGSVNANGLYFAPQTISTATTLPIRATSVQDSSKYGQGNVTVNPTAPPQGTYSDPIVFSDASGNGWYIELWSNTTLNPTSPIAHDGENGLEVTTSSQWGRMQFTAWANYKFNTSGYNYLNFWVNTGANESEVLYVGLLNSGYSVIQYVNLASQTPKYIENGVLTPYQWKYVSIPLSALGAASADIYGVEIQSGNAADDVQFSTIGVCQ